MKLYFGTEGWGWNLWGIVGKNSRWFFGLSRAATKDERIATQAELVCWEAYQGAVFLCRSMAYRLDTMKSAQLGQPM